MSIDDFIIIVAPKIKKETMVTYDQMSGEDLILTGVQEVKGEKVSKKKMYRIPVPVIIEVNHTQKLKLAWLRGGKQGVRNYLGKFLKKDILATVLGTLNDRVNDIKKKHGIQSTTVQQGEA